MLRSARRPAARRDGRNVWRPRDQPRPVLIAGTLDAIAPCGQHRKLLSGNARRTVGRSRRSLARLASLPSEWRCAKRSLDCGCVADDGAQISARRMIFRRGVCFIPARRSAVGGCASGSESAASWISASDIAFAWVQSCLVYNDCAADGAFSFRLSLIFAFGDKHKVVVPGVPCRNSGS